MSTLATERPHLASRRKLQLALPAPGDELAQDEEWVVVRTDRGWKQVRLHDYNDVYAVPGLYERWVYDIFQCGSPAKIRELFAQALRAARVDPRSLCVLDLGAGNGIVGEELNSIGVERLVGVDIHVEAADATERDRPGLYTDYVVGDLTDPSPENEAALAQHDFNCLTCVAALGFGDIPTEVFTAAYNRIADNGWVAFTIKHDFLTTDDTSGFAHLIRRITTDGTLEVAKRESYVHRISTDGKELVYDAFIGRKRRDIAL